MSNVIDSLLVRIGFDVDTHGVEGAKHHVGLLKESLEALGIMAGVELAHRFVEFVERAVSGAAAVQEFAETTGIAADKVDSMSRAAADAGVPVEAMREAIMGVFRATGAAAAGFPRYTKLFQQLGLNAKDSTGHVKDAQTMMGELSDKFSKMDAATRIAVAGRLGINARLAALMGEEGSAGMRGRFAETEKNGLLTAEDFERAHGTELALEKLHRTIQGVTTIVANQLSPWLVKALDLFQEWWKANREEVVRGFIGGVRELAGVLKTVGSFLRDVYGFGKDVLDTLDRLGIKGGVLKGIVGAIVAYKLGGWALQAAAGLAQLAVGFGGLQAATLFVGLLAGAIALLVQDIYVFYKGGNSLIGQLSEEWPGALEAAQLLVVALGVALTALVTGSGPLSLAVAAIGGFALAGKDLKDNWEPVLRWFEDRWDEVADTIAENINTMSAPLRALAGLLGIKIPTMDEHHGRTRLQKKIDADFNAKAPYQEFTNGNGPLREVSDMTPRWNMLTKVRYNQNPAVAGAAGAGATFTGTVVNIYNRNAEEAAKSHESVVKGTKAAAVRRIRHARPEGI